MGIEQLFGAPVQPRYRDGLGSGVIVSAEGHIITNQHVIQNSQRIRARLADGREAPVVVVGSDPDTDLAVLKIDLPNLPVMRLGRSDRVAVGDRSAPDRGVSGLGQGRGGDEEGRRNLREARRRRV